MSSSPTTCIPPPLRAVKYRNERLERLKTWKGHTDDMYMICQARAEIGQDPELADALYEANIRMLYLGVESDNAENLKLVNKRQDPGDVHRNLVALNQKGFSVVAHDHYRPALRYRREHHGNGRLGDRD